MRTFCELLIQGLFRRLRPELLVMLLGVSLAGCGGGGGDSSDPPAPPAPPAPGPPPPPPPAVPPVSSTPISLDDNHTVGAAHWPDGDTSVGGQGQTVAGLDCVVSLPETYHVHTHLSVFLNGEALAIPRNVGIVAQTPTSNCFYPLHAHDSTGLVHAEAAAPATFTLGQFFSIWGQSLASADIAGLTSMPVVVYVTDDGVVSQATGDWSLIELDSHREITIQVGTPITEIPNYVWTGN